MNRPDHKNCSDCKNHFPATPDFFHRNDNTSDGLISTCKACVKKNRVRYAGRYDLAANSKRYYQKHKQRLKEKRILKNN